MKCIGVRTVIGGVGLKLLDTEQWLRFGVVLYNDSDGEEMVLLYLFVNEMSLSECVYNEDMIVQGVVLYDE